ncbi:MAG: hypothetical protein RI560_13000 [Natronomonas sp.]|jgi:hypothetical protein|nr:MULTISPECIES: hypothetical protein [Natronomonas]MDR9382572.1 hypothetical protein [Natronomonas sp.]MDR9429615.1 hypothetical protein [Natronomonas sp.]
MTVLPSGPELFVVLLSLLFLLLPGAYLYMMVRERRPLTQLGRRWR